jgi:4-amino-4-deoxy-L-arabinose transferase-like glycosyltransferase
LEPLSQFRYNQAVLGNTTRDTAHEELTRSPHGVVFAVSIAGLLVFFFMVLQAATTQSPTYDEGTHMLRGRLLWDSADFSIQGQHTPLSHWFIGALFFSEPTIPDLGRIPSLSERSPGSLGWEFLWQNAFDVNRLLVLGRLPVIFVGLLLGALLARWAKMLSGLVGLIIAMVLYAFSPNILAAASVATTDLMAAATFTGAIFAAWFYWRRPSFGRWLLSGLLLGLALASKLTAVLLLPLTLLLAYAGWRWLAPAAKRQEPWWRPSLVWLGSVLVAGFVLWMVYGAEVARISGLPFPIPAATYFQNFVQVQEHIERGHSSFLLGELSFGWWHYFLVAFLVKTPLVALVLLGLSVFYLCFAGRWRKTIFLWLPATALFAAASYSQLNIGYRHILPMIPLVWLLIAAAGPLWLRSRGALLLLGVLLVLYSLSTLRYQPHFLAYFNEAVGGPSQGYRYLGDSNLDWGQDLGLVADYVEQSTIPPTLIAYYGTGNPGYYGLEVPSFFDGEGNVVGFARANPAPGRYIISASRLQGAVDYEPHLFDWFRRRKPDEQIGYTYHVYDVPSSRTGAWISHCLDPEPQLSETEAEQLVGLSQLRHLYFDCENSWLVPGGHQPGWYILPDSLEPDRFEKLLGDTLTMVFSNAYSPKTPAFKVYYWSGDPQVEERIMAHSELAMLADGTKIELPAPVGKAATFLGGWREDNTWFSAWQAGDDPGSFLSVLMHLHTAGTSPIIGDDLGYPSAYWQAGDTFIQFHDFGQQAAEYLETGLYDYNTLERLLFTLTDSSNTSVRISPE